MPSHSAKADKRGYLREEFRLFHPKGREGSAFPYHYHEFHKILLLLSGSLTYLVEGRTYTLRPGDLLMIPAHAIHQPVIDPESVYDRVVLWIQPQAIGEQGLDECFQRCAKAGSYLLAREEYEYPRLSELLKTLEVSVRGEDLRDDVLSDALLRQILVLLCRFTASLGISNGTARAFSDPKIDEILRYINSNLEDDLSIDALSARFFLSRSRLMHRFKQVTGCPVHQYVLQKRLILAAKLLQEGCSVTRAAERSGFSDYSAFLRSFRRAYHVPPGSYRNTQSIYATEDTL